MTVNWSALAVLSVWVFTCLICALIPVALWKRVSAPLNLNDSYIMEPEGRSFQPLLEKYLDIVKLLVSLSVGSIALLAGYVGYVIQSEPSKLPKIQYAVASPIMFFAFSVLYAVVLMASLVSGYEGYLHDSESYTGKKYAMNLTVGSSSLICFAIGYFLLAIAVVSIAL